MQPDLVIVDLVIGELSGRDLLESLQQESITRDILVIEVSTTDELLERARAEQVRYGADRYIVKPLDIDELMGTVRCLVGSA